MWNGGGAAPEGSSGSPDVAIVDSAAADAQRRGHARSARDPRRSSGVGVLVLSQYVEVGLAMQLLAESADGAGYLLKDRISDVKEFVGAVKRVAAGGSVDGHRLHAALEASGNDHSPT